MEKYSIKINELGRFAILQCCNCTAEVRLETVLEQYENGYKWRVLPNGAGKLLCGYCAHQIFDEHDENNTKFDSITCKCGTVIR